jgi:hypothetical protein
VSRPTSTLLPTPGSVVDASGRLLVGLTAGALRTDPLDRAPRTGRARRWSYAAAAGDGVAVGAALVDLGLAGTVFVWVSTDRGVRTWERRILARRGLRVGPDPDGGWAYRRPGHLVALDHLGGLRVSVGVGGERLAIDLDAGPITPVVLATATSEGGWNVTEKAAGYRCRGTVRIGAATWSLEGAGWRDRTVGRQDRHTHWRWAAAAGRAEGGGHVGLNVSTGMNAAGPGEDVVWWDGQPYALTVDVLEPEHEPEGPWRVAGPGWGLRFTARGVRAAAENLLVVRSRYVQPIGTFSGTLPGPGGAPVPVEGLPGVTEEHAATW